MDLIKRRFTYLAVSGLVLLIGIVSLLAPSGIKPGVEFTSGSTMTLEFSEEVTQEALRQELAALGYREAVIQRLEGGGFFLRLSEITREEKAQLEEALRQKLGELTVLDFYSVSPVVAREVGRNAAIAVVVAGAGILLYIAWAFRRVPRPFRWGSCAVIALAHDVLIVLGTFSFLGRLFNIPIDALFITAALAVVGYSVNNVVVVFDRLRENLLLEGTQNFTQTINRSLVQTLGRCLNSSLTTLFALLAVLLFGGATIRNFALALTIGVAVGTYTSLFVAPMVLLLWERGRR